jgi:3-(3-hydroxy-phenyl)propionate hydroxylase
MACNDLSNRTGTQNDYQVVIVGFGPSGALAGNLLGQAGVQTLCVDRSTTVYDKPRAIALDHEILRILDNIGLAETVAPFIAPFDLSEHFGADGRLLRRIGMVGQPYPLGYTPTMVFTQPPLEAALRQHAQSWPSVEALLGTEVTGLSEQANGVSLDLVDANGGTSSVTADYVIACDGASSRLRGLLGLELDDLNFDEPWVVIDLWLNPDKLDRLPENSAHFCEPARPSVYIVGPGTHRRWEIMLMEGEDPREMEKPERVWELLRRWVGPEDATLWRAASYRFHALVLHDWNRGRVYFAGDAAHQQPPILGQGMCQGMRDVTNLTWKLQAVLKGSAAPDLLDSYGEERQAHVRELIEQIKLIGEVLCERDAEAAARRDARVLFESDGTPATITRQSVIPPLRCGLLSPRCHSGTGTLIPQPHIETERGGGLLDRVYGTGWRLVVDGRSGNNLAPTLQAAVAELGVRILILSSDAAREGGVTLPETFLERDDVLASWFAENRAATALVRPDHYVFGTAETLDATIDLVEELARSLHGNERAAGRPSERDAAA